MLYLSIILLLILLIFPEICIQGATSGLLLWFNTIIPTLFPFLLTTNIISYKNGFTIFEKTFGKFVKNIFHTSPSGAYPILTGLLCGYPMGAKSTVDAYIAGKISKEEAHYLLTFTNNPSPIFIANYVCIYVLENSKLIIPYLLIIYLGSLITAQITYRSFHFKTSYYQQSNTIKESFFDKCITDACDTLVHIGGYMMIFSIIAELLLNIPLINTNLSIIICGFLEQTTGLNLLKISLHSEQIKTVLAMSFAGFGGLSILAQTYSIIHRHGLSLKYYLIGKGLFTSIIGILTFIYQSISS